MIEKDKIRESNVVHYYKKARNDEIFFSKSRETNSVHSYNNKTEKVQSKTLRQVCDRKNILGSNKNV